METNKAEKSDGKFDIANYEEAIAAIIPYMDYMPDDEQLRKALLDQFVFTAIH